MMNSALELSRSLNQCEEEWEIVGPPEDENEEDVVHGLCFVLKSHLGNKFMI